MLELSMKITLKELFIWGFINLAAMISVVMMIEIKNEEYRWLFLLPLSYCIFNILFVRVFLKQAMDSFAIMLIHGFYFIRIVLAPLLFAFCGCRFPFRNETNATLVIVLMIYEMLMVYMVVLIWSIKISKTVSKQLNINEGISRKCKKLLLGLIIVLIGLFDTKSQFDIALPLWFEFFDYEFTGFTSTEVIRQYSNSFIKKFGIVTFRYVFNLSRVTIPCIIAMLMKQKQKNNNQIIISTLTAIFVFDFLIMDDTFAYSICYVLVDFTFLSRLLNEGKILKKALFATAGLVILFFLSRFILSQTVFTKEGISTNPFEYVSGVLQAYFSGITNIGAALNLNDGDILERMKYLVYEILRGIPYASTIFRLDSTSLGTYFNTVNGSVGQIVPLLGASKFYFGYAFAPVLSCALVSIGLRANCNLVRSSNPFRVIALITVSLYAILGISMYSLEIVCVGFFCVALPILILGRIIN